jgi:hypothetical protein
MEKGRHRFSVTADAYGLTYSGISRSLASRPPYRTDFEVTPIRPTIAVQDHLSESRLRSHASRFGLAPRPAGRRACCFIKWG